MTKEKADVIENLGMEGLFRWPNGITVVLVIPSLVLGQRLTRGDVRIAVKMRGTGLEDVLFLALKMKRPPPKRIQMGPGS